MKRIFLLFYIFSSCLVMSTSLPAKKIVIFTSGGGHGTRSVDTILSSHLKKDYIVELAFVFPDILAPIDPIRKITFNRYSGEDLQNFFARRGWIRSANAVCKFAQKSYIPSCQKNIDKLIDDYIQTKKPDLLISLVPLVNANLARIAKKHNVPLIIIPTDLDVSSFWWVLLLREHYAF